MERFSETITTAAIALSIFAFAFIPAARWIGQNMAAISAALN